MSVKRMGQTSDCGEGHRRRHLVSTNLASKLRGAPQSKVMGGGCQWIARSESRLPNANAGVTAGWGLSCPDSWLSVRGFRDHLQRFSGVTSVVVITCVRMFIWWTTSL